jgi:hypothetical protein
MSGKYLPLQYNELAKHLEISAFVPKVAKAEELSFLAGETEPTIASQLAREVLERSASLMASEIAGLYEFKGSPSKLGLIGEGSMLWKGWNYVPNMQRRLELLGIPPGTVKIRKVLNSSIKGAIALLTA